MRKAIKILAGTLSLALVMQMIPVMASAPAQTGTDPSADQQTPTTAKTDPQIVGELTDKRQANMKYFRLSDGTFEAVEYQNPVHYLDNGQWKDIDNSLSEVTDDTTAGTSSQPLGGLDENTDKTASSAGILQSKKNPVADKIPDGYENKANSLDVKFAKDASASSLVRVRDGKYQIAWNLNETDKNPKSAFAKQKKADEDASKLTSIQKNDQKFTSVDNINSGVTYGNILSDVDLNYSLVSQNLKENIVLKSSKSKNSFQFTYQLDNLELKTGSDGVINVVDPADGSVKYIIPKPIMTDAAGITSSDVGMSFDKNKSGNGYTVTLTADQSWLDSSDRQFPVTIDPDLQTPLDKNKIHETFVASSTPSTNYYLYGSTYVGHETSEYGTCRTYMYFDLPSLSPSEKITNAQLSLYQYKCSPTGISNYQINAHAVNSAFNITNLTWNNQPAYSSTISDYCTADGSQNWRYWDITKIVSDWYTSGTNTGVALTADNESTGTDVQFYSSDYPNLNTGGYPSVMFHYVDTTGLEDYWTYHTQDAGRAGTGYVNNFSGQVTVDEKDISETGSRMPVTVDHIFNNSLVKDNSSYSSQAVKYGNGWKLNVVERLQATDSNLASRGYPYYLTDGDGTQHYFYKDPNNASAPTQDEDGLGYTLTSVSEGQITHKITTKDNTVMKFDTWGYLRFISDANGNTMTIYYQAIPNVDNYLSSIVDGAGRTISFQYDSNHVLTGIVDASGRLTSYKYDGSGRLTSIVYPDGKSASYTYDSSNRISMVKNIDGQTINYSNYNNRNQVTRIDEKGTSNEQGKWLSVSYPDTYSTKFTDNLGQTETYEFDNFGRTVNILGADGNATMNIYNSDGQSNNKVASTGMAQKTVINELTNSGFENGLTDWSIVGTGVSTQAGSLDGNAMLKTINSNADDYSAATQFVSLPTGTYTYSGYVKTSNVSNTGNNAALEVAINTSSGQRWAYSNKITGSTNSDINNGWQRISVTFTIASGETIQRVSAGLFQAIGTAYFDNLQLESGEAVNKYNLLDNGGLDNCSGSVPDGWSGSNLGSSDSSSTNISPAGGTKSFSISGNTGLTKYIGQTIPITGSEGDVFSISGWAKATSVPLSGNNRQFCLSVSVNYTDGTKQWYKANFNTMSQDWQYTSGTFSTDDNNASTTKSYQSISVYYCYYYNAGVSYIDDLQLTKDDGQSYVYDSNGNLVSTKDSAKQNSTYAYDSSNNLIKATSPSGSSFSYTYDDKHNALTAMNNSNMQYSINYDSYGNPVSSSTAGNSAASIANGGVYYIRSVTSNQYLDFDDSKDQNGTQIIQWPYNGGLNQRWRLVDVGNGYYKIVSLVSATGRVLDVTGAANTDATPIEAFTDNGSSSQKWKINKNADGTYTLLSSCSNLTKCLDVPNASATEGIQLQQNTANQSSSQEFVFEPAADLSENLQSTTTLTNNQKYYIRASGSNLFLGLYDYSDANGTGLIQNTYSGEPDEQWQIVSTGDGNYKIVCVGSKNGAVIDSNGATNSNGALIDIYSSNGSNAQKWKISSNSDGTFSLFSACSNFTKCVDVQTGSTSPGGTVQNTSNGSATQKFYFEPVPSTLNTAPATSIQSGKKYFIQNNFSKLFVAPMNAGNKDSTDIVQDTRNCRTYEVWKVTQNADGYYTITNSASGMNLELTGGSDTNGSQIELYTPDDSAAQEWSFTHKDDGSFKIAPKCSTTRVLDDTGVSVAPQTDVELWADSGNSWQSFNLIPANDSVLSMQSSAAYTSDGDYMSSLTDSRGNATTYNYDTAKGTLKSETDANGNTTSYTYDPNTDAATGVSKTVGGNAVSNSYVYSGDKLSSITHNGFNYNFAYDGFGNTSSVSVGSQKLITNTYAANDGNLTSSTYGNGQTVGFSYDALDRVTGKSYNGNLLFSWIYDALGNIGVYTDNVNNVKYNYSYDDIGRTTSILGSNGQSTYFSYDKYNRTSGLTDVLGSNTFVTKYAYNTDNLPTTLTIGKNDQVSNVYDGLNRLSSKTFRMQSGTAYNYLTGNYSYLSGTGSNTTTLLSGISYTKNVNGTDSSLRNLGYTYDKNGNILTISEGGVLKVTYHYDELNELTREDNLYLNKTITYTYDAGGNLTAKTEHTYSTGTLGAITATHSYAYGDSNWKDKLTSYDGSAITYDAIGNPLSYLNGWNFTWQQGRQLASASNGTTNISYKYNSDGIRTSKTVNGVTTTYYIEDGNIAWQTDGTNTIHYTYDANGDLAYMNLNGTLYYYERNGQGDIIGLVDSNMNEVVSYSYDSWGKLLSVGGSLASSVGALNPFRYRDYYYDTETGLYYLNSRYYDPSTCRMLNADGDVSTATGLLGYNMFAYCNNNPALMHDDGGDRPAIGTTAYGQPGDKNYNNQLSQENAAAKAAAKVTAKNSKNKNVTSSQPSSSPVSGNKSTPKNTTVSVGAAWMSTGETAVWGVAGAFAEVSDSALMASYGYAFATPWAIASHMNDPYLTPGEQYGLSWMEFGLAGGGILVGLLLTAWNPVGWTVGIAVAIGIGYDIGAYFVSDTVTKHYEIQNRRRFN